MSAARAAASAWWVCASSSRSAWRCSWISAAVVGSVLLVMVDRTVPRTRCRSIGVALRSGGPHRVDRRQVLGGRAPGRARVARAEDLAGGGPEVELERLARARLVERLAQDRQVRVLGREAVAALGPRLAGVARLPHPRAAV